MANIPLERVVPPETLFLERDQVQKILDNLVSKDPMALRDRTLIMFLYNTGARVQEVADLRLANLDFEAQPRVNLQGKGGKWKVCPLWTETASLLKNLIDSQKVTKLDDPIFVSRQGRALTRFGIYKIVVRHTKIISLKGLNTKTRLISPHVFRHTTAVHLLESGVEPNVIRSWLGHVDLDTTYRYAEINIHAKEAALKAIELDPKYADAYAGMGFIYMMGESFLPLFTEGETDIWQAQSYLEKAIELDPDYAEAWYNRGYSYELLGELSNARKDYQKTLSVRPNYQLAITGMNRLDQMSSVE